MLNIVVKKFEYLQKNLQLLCKYNEKNVIMYLVGQTFS